MACVIEITVEQIGEPDSHVRLRAGGNRHAPACTLTTPWQCEGFSCRKLASLTTTDPGACRGGADIRQGAAQELAQGRSIPCRCSLRRHSLSAVGRTAPPLDSARRIQSAVMAFPFSGYRRSGRHVRPPLSFIAPSSPVPQGRGAALSPRAPAAASLRAARAGSGPAPAGSAGPRSRVRGNRAGAGGSLPAVGQRDSRHVPSIRWMACRPSRRAGAWKEQC